MKLQESITLSSIYKREEDFSADLAQTLDALNIGKFEDPETESSVGTRKADIVAVGEDGVQTRGRESVRHGELGSLGQT